MKIRQLEAFLAVVESGGIRAAGRAIHVSQSAVARAIAQLEEDYHCVFFVRSTNGRCELTPEGRAFLPYATSIVEELERAQEAIAQMNGGGNGTVRAAISPFIPGEVTIKGLRLFRSRYRRVNLEIRDGIYSSVMPMLNSSLIDFAITLITDNLIWPDDSIRTKTLFKVKQGLIANHRHPIFKSSNPQDVARYEMIISAGSQEAARQRVGETFVKKGLAWPVNITVCDALLHDQLLKAPNSEVIGVAPYSLQSMSERDASGEAILKIIDFGKAPGSSMLALPPLSATYLVKNNVPITPAAQYLADCMLFAIKEWVKANPSLFTEVCED